MYCLKWGLTEVQSAANRYCTASRLDRILFVSLLLTCTFKSLFGCSCGQTQHQISHLRQYWFVNCNQPVYQFISASKDRSEVANCCAAILRLCMHGHSQADRTSIKHLSEVAERFLRLIEANWQIILLTYF